MRVTLLVDNCLPVGSPLYAESGFSAFVECDGKNILLDAGASALLLHNAAKLGIDLLQLDYIVLTHHHSDHTGGLPHLAKLYDDAGIERRPELVCHPDLFAGRDGGGQYRLPDRQRLGRSFGITMTEGMLPLTASLCFLTGIPRNSHEQQQVFGMVELSNGRREPDIVQEEGFLAYRGREGLTVVTGCTHCGVCNAVRHAKSRLAYDRLHCVMGGLHLLQRGRAELAAIAQVLEAEQVASLLCCHCTEFAAACALRAHLPLEQLCCGQSRDFA